jgi:uncharacterized membrane protein (DUF106 family)
MANPRDAWRRWLGLFCLAVAAGLLIWGQTVLKPHLSGLGFMLYWGVCFLFTFAAIVIALIDMRMVRQHILEERKELLQRTLEEIEQAKNSKNDRAAEPPRTEDGGPD